VTRILERKDSEQTNRGIVAVFQEFLRGKFKPTSVDAECVRRMMEAVQGRLSDVERDALDISLDLEELRRLLHKGGGNKAPGRDGIFRAFFTETWEDLKEDWLELFSDMFERGRLLGQQKNGVIVCIPKTRSTSGPRDYRPIALLNTDYKIFARILAD
jgi:hypothetical protein